MTRVGFLRLAGRDAPGSRRERGARTGLRESGVIVVHSTVRHDPVVSAVA